MVEPIIKGLSHIAIAVPSISVIEKWLSLFPDQKITKYSSEEQKVNAVVVHLDNFDLEFLEPSTTLSSISGFLEKNPRGGVHHLCFYVTNLELALCRVKKEGIRKITLRKALGVIHGFPIAFLNPKDLAGALVEFEEQPQT
jgi:methylmalonyl-CoA/ethylmalonyl-CoA epimerase